MPIAYTDTCGEHLMASCTDYMMYNFQLELKGFQDWLYVSSSARPSSACVGHGGSSRIDIIISESFYQEQTIIVAWG